MIRYMLARRAAAAARQAFPETSPRGKWLARGHVAAFAVKLALTVFWGVMLGVGVLIVAHQMNR